MSQLSGGTSEVGPSSSQSDDGTSRIPPQPGGSSSGSTSAADQSSRQSNLQRIQQRKQQVYNWPHNKKLLKLAIYSACQVIAFMLIGSKTSRSVQSACPKIFSFEGYSVFQGAVLQIYISDFWFPQW
jgi:hypothetical protein